MTSSVTVVDLAAGKVLKTFPVDPGPRALAVNAAKNQLLVLAEGTGTLDVVDLNSYARDSGSNAGETERQGTWVLPLISTVAPNTAAAGAAPFTLTITGSNFQEVNGLEFEISGMSGGGGMMGGGGMGSSEDPNIKVSNVQVNSAGTQITATVQILSGAAAGTRQIRLETARGEVMGPMFNSFFSITK